MATWTLKATLVGGTAGGVYVGRDAATDGTLVYYIQTNSEVFKWDVATDTETAISAFADGGATRDTSGRNLVWFESGLYVLGTFTAGNALRVYKYDGTGTSWTQVDSVASVTPYHLAADGTELAIVYLAATLDSRYSADGATWGDGSLEDVPDEVVFYLTQGAQGENCIVTRTRDQLIGPTTDVWRFCKWNATSHLFETVGAYDDVPNTGDAWLLNWMSYARQDEFRYWVSADDVTWQRLETYSGTPETPGNTTGRDILPAEGKGMAQSCGWSFDDANDRIYFHLLDGGGDWDAGEIIDTSAGRYGTNGAALNHVVRLTDDTALALVRSGNYVYLFERDEALPDPATSTATLTHSAGGIPGSILVS